jgi:hypothetical protein
MVCTSLQVFFFTNAALIFISTDHKYLARVIQLGRIENKNQSDI